VTKGFYDIGFSTDIWIWSMVSKKVIDKLIGHVDGITTLEHISSSNLLISGSCDGIVFVWDLNSCRILKVLSGKNQPKESKNGRPTAWGQVQRRVIQIRFSEKANLVAACYSDGSLIFWNYPEFKQVMFISGIECKASSIDFSPDGKILISGGYDGNLRYWQVETGHLLEVHWGHRARINSVSFSRNQQYIATGSSDGTVRIWGLDNRKELGF
jgi:WD40 repeat protein